ncbi:MAG: hypothetical protein JWQ33_2656 [Ramlibacter sp.]|nr:hypothetical protein [Ramlibacter sp.]
MIAKTLEWTVGFVLAWATLRDVFDTVVVPGRARGALRISHHLLFFAVPAWKRLFRKGVGVGFAPVVLLSSFLVWMLLLMLAFGLMTHALGSWFSPPLQGFGEALYLAGSALATIGLGNSQAYGPACAVAVAAGFCGLAVMTMAVTYLLEVQSNVAVRDTGVLKITTTSGHPPSALGLLERYGAMGCRDELRPVLRNGRDWCAAVLQSHASHPSLIYFRSAAVGSGWPATLGALMDLALIMDLLLDEPGRGLAVLVREEAERLARELTKLLGLEPAPTPVTAAEVDSLCSRLAAAGYSVRPDIDVAGFIAARHQRVDCIEALSQHLGTAGAPLVPP